MAISRQAPGPGQWQQLIAQLHDLIFPPRCVACDAAGHALCDHCAQLVVPAAAPLCARCGRLQATPADTCAMCELAPHVPQQVRAAAVHTGVMREAIHALKYNGVTALAAPLARYLTAAWQAPAWDAMRTRVDLVVPVPLHAERLQERGYNQAALLAQSFCRQNHLVFAPATLMRRRATQSQVGLDAAARAVNVAGAFSAPTRLDGAVVLLVDDVYTTGATLGACTRAALDAGAQTVVALTLALPSRKPVTPEKEESAASAAQTT